MQSARYTFCFLLLPFLIWSAPDTTKIPSKWKNESIVVLEHVYRAEETNFDDGRFKEYIKIVFYIRDKYGLQQLSTFNIPTYIVPGAEMQIGKVYKKNNTTVDLTSKHLIPIRTKIDVGNRRRNSSTRSQDNGQKLAIPSLEVGDILEIEYYSKRKEFINYLNLDVNYPTLKSDFSISIIRNINAQVATIQYKAINFPTSKIETSPDMVNIKRENIEKIVDESLSDDNKTQPYLIIWKTYESAMESSGFNNEKNKNYLEIKDEELKKQQLNLTNYIFDNDLYEQYVATNLKSLIDEKHKKITDTVGFISDLFYMYREMVAMKCITENNSSNESYAYDKYFVNVVSRVLFEKKVPYKVFLSQAEYYGAPLSANELMSAKYGIYFPRFNYFLFNPFAYTLPNQIPSYFEDQLFVYFNANKHFYPFGGKKKYCEYGFWQGTFPHSTAVENLTHTKIELTDINTQKQNCTLDLKTSYWGKNKNRYTKNICSNTLLYELADNEYRKTIKDKFPTYIDIDVDSDKHDNYLKNFLTDDAKSDGYDFLKLKSFAVNETNFFNAAQPVVTNYSFETNDILTSFDNYIIINAGKLLGSQLVYNRKDSVRQTNFYIPYKKKYTFFIRIEIPNGYTVENISDLSMSFSSTAGKFESKAAINKNYVEVTTEKSYNFVDYLNKDEKDIKGFLDLAIEFNQKKLILKKS